MTTTKPQQLGFLTEVLKGLSQIMLQSNVWTGLLFLLGILLASIPMGLGAILATSIGTMTAKMLKHDKAEIADGLYGFSPALVGVAMLLFFQNNLYTWILLVIGSAAASMLQHFFIRKKISAFTLPFVLVTWVLIVLANRFFPNLLTQVDPKNIPDQETLLQQLSYSITSFGQVIFQDNLFSGLLFFIAVFISSPIAALYGLVAAMFASMVANLLGMPDSAIFLGLWGYNSVLCAITFAIEKPKDGFWIVLAIGLALLCQIVLVNHQIIPLTFPFVFGSMLVVLIKEQRIIRFSKNKT